MKKPWLFILSICSALLFVLIRNTIEDMKQPEKEQWQTYEKRGNELKTSRTPKEVIKNLRLRENVQGNRNMTMKKNIVSFDKGPKRELIGSKDIEGKVLQYQNTPHPNWKQFLGKHLMHHQKDGVKLYIKKSKSLLFVHHDKATYQEEVNITMLLPNGHRGDYKAVVDSQTGKVLRTYDRSFTNRGIMPFRPEAISASGQL